MYTKERNSWIKHLDFIILDIISLNLSYLAAYYIRFPKQILPYFSYTYGSIILVFSLLLLLSSFILNSYSGILQRGSYVELTSVAILAVLSLALVSLFIFSIHVADKYSRLLIYYTTAIFVVLDYVFRILLKKAVIAKLKNNSKLGINAREAFVFTDRAGFEKIVSDIRNDFFEAFSIKGIAIADDPCLTSKEYTIVQEEDAPAYICREWIDDVFIYLPGRNNVPDQFLNACTEMGVTVHVVMNFGNVDRNKQFIENVGGNTALTIAYSYSSPGSLLVKRVADILGGLVGTALAVLIGLVLAPFVISQSPGPLIFKQLRVGRNGKKFYIYKFRSMHLDAEERKKDLLAGNRVSNGMMFKLDFDPRIIGNKVLPDGTRKTGIGEFIRKTSLDEFPQFFNVLKGDMSLVGTRPPTLDEWEKYQYHHRARLAMKPGITGMWQVSGRSNITDFEEVVRLDTEYITHFSLGLDLKILLKTILVIFKRKGAM